MISCLHKDRRSLIDRNSILAVSKRLSLLFALCAVLSGTCQGTDQETPEAESATAASLASTQSIIASDDRHEAEPLEFSSQSSVLLYAGLTAFAIVSTITVVAIMSWLRCRHRLARLEPIRTQLARWARNRATSVSTLESVPVNGPESLGWNIVLHQLMTDASFGSKRTDSLRAQGSHELSSLIQDLPEGFAFASVDGSLTLLNDTIKGMLKAFSDDRNQASDTTPSTGEEQPGSSIQDSEELQIAAIAHELATLVPDHRLMSQRPTVDIIEGKGPASGRFLRVARYPRWDHESQEFEGTTWVLRDITQQKLAEKMRDEFLDSATHELRTPLANIKAYAETLALSDVLEVEQQKEFCNTINAEATRLARLIDDLLSISSMEVGSLSVSCQRTEVDRMLREVVQRVQPSMNKKGQKFHVLIDEKIPEMKLDKDKFSTILVNLLGNASKYTPGEGNVTLRARVLEQALLIDVEDTGVGISEEELPRVFEKFFRSNDPRIQNENGTGLGLSLTQELVRLHGGTLSVRSQLNQGSCFTIRLPL